MKREIYVRNLEKRDLLSIVAMEERVTGIARPQYWSSGQTEMQHFFNRQSFVQGKMLHY